MAQTRATAKQVTFKGDGTGAVVRNIHDKLGDTVSVKDFGAVGDGVTDDTAAIQAAIDSGAHEIVFASGVYSISEAITEASSDSLTIVGEEATITTAVDGLAMFDLVGLDNLKIVGLTFDGNDSGQRGVATDGNVSIERCVFKNFATKTSFCAAVYLFYPSLSAGEIRYANISNCSFKDFGGEESGTVGAALGATRAIYIRQPTLETAGVTINIHDNYFDSIFGREGDIIQITTSLTKQSGGLDRVTISNNYFGGSNRRALKIQSWNVTVENNHFETIDPSHPKYGLDGQGGAGIISFSGETGAPVTTGHVCRGNTFKNKNGLKGSIYVTSAELDCSGNAHKCPDPFNTSLFISHNNGYSVCVNNIIESYGSSILLNNNCVFSNNTVNVKSGGYAIPLGGASSSENIIVSKNTFNIDGSVTNSVLGVLFISDFSSLFSGVLVEGNIVKVPEGTDTRNRSKLVYFSAASSATVGDITFANNHLNSDSSPFHEDSDLDYSYTRFVSNSSKWADDHQVTNAFGDNLVTNPLITSGTGWTISSGSSYEADYQGILLKTGRLEQSLNVTSGSKYLIRMKAVDLGNVNFTVYLGNDQARNKVISRNYSSVGLDFYVDYTGATGAADFLLLPVSADCAITEIYAYELA